MTNEELIQKIRAEIERLKAKYRKDMYKSNHEGLASGYKIEAYNELLSFLSTLESEKPMQEGLEEEIHRLWESFADEMEGPHNLFDIYARLARHFAQWQKEQDEKELSDLLTIAHLQGADQMKEQMLKEAVEVIVEDWNPDPEPEITIPLNPEEFTCGDRVRVIICKKED